MADEKPPAQAPGPSQAFTAHKKRSDKIWTDRNEWRDVVRSCYDYVAPYRKSTDYTKDAPGTQNLRVFDNTLAQSWVRSTGRLQQDLFPSGEMFFSLQPGPAVEGFNIDREEARYQLETVTDQMQPIFLNGEWDAQNFEMLGDANISTGFMMIIDGDDYEPVRFITAAIEEVALDSGPYGRFTLLTFRRKWTYRNIKDNWPRGQFDADFVVQLTNNPDTEVELCQDVVWNSARRIWEFRAYTVKCSKFFHTEESFECPWVVPRYFRMPNQAYGFGPTLLQLPTAKTLNKTLEASLMAAALALGGIFTQVDDGVFNPDNARIGPGEIWKVARNGGALGPSISRLDIPGNFNIGHIVLQDLRQQIHAGMNDDQLPPDGQSPRSAAEIVERIKRLSRDNAGAAGRLIHECAQPVVRRVMEILWRKGALPMRFSHPMLMQIEVTSPLAQAFKMQRVKRVVDWAQIVLSLGGADKLKRLMPEDTTFADMAADMGVPSKHVRRPSTREEIDQTVQELVQMALAQAAEAQRQSTLPPPAPNGDPANAEMSA
ncbi:MAG TPA: portal protein [Beijerinckiaceae bacterium]|jgi:hypothetical protein|nr:portal protein [Beijerinckiaceae bacterium]